MVREHAAWKDEGQRVFSIVFRSGSATLHNGYRAVQYCTRVGAFPFPALELGASYELGGLS